MTYRRHINHLYEANYLTFKQLKKILQDIATGFTDTFEKFDGANLLVSLDDQENLPIVARAQQDIDAGGLNKEKLLHKFSGADKMSDVFGSAYDAICEFFNNSNANVLKEVFNPFERQWISAEVVSESAVNIIPYSKNCVLFHRTGISNAETLKESFDNLFNIINEGQKFNEGNWMICPPKKANINEISAGKLKKHFESLNMIAIRGRVLEEATIGQYKEKWLKRKMLENLTTIYSSRKLNEIENYILKKEPIPRLIEIKKGLSKLQEVQAKNFIENRKNILEEIMFPLEKVIFEFTRDLLGGQKSYLVEDNEIVVNEINKKTEFYLTAVKNENIACQNAKRILRENKANSSVEGVVFEVDGNNYKMIGNYKYINRLKNEYLKENKK